MDEPTVVTRLLGELARGHQEAMGQIMPLVYEELHRLAHGYFRRERRAHTLQPTALVHEAYIRLAGQREPIESRAHFLALAATLMRRILLDYARKHQAERRGGAEERVSLEDSMAICGPRAVDLIALDSALTKLARLDPKQAQMVELRFFGGLSVEETAEIIGVSTPTVKRGWRSARAFLRRELEGERRDAGALGSDTADL